MPPAQEVVKSTPADKKPEKEEPTKITKKRESKADREKKTAKSGNKAGKEMSVMEK